MNSKYEVIQESDTQAKRAVYENLIDRRLFTFPHCRILIKDNCRILIKDNCRILIKDRIHNLVKEQTEKGAINKEKIARSLDLSRASIDYGCCQLRKDSKIGLYRSFIRLPNGGFKYNIYVGLK